MATPTLLLDRTTRGTGARAPAAGRSLHIQLRSCNYDPEPSGIAPLSAAWAKAMIARGHRVEVVAAHPHYPTPIWGSRRRPYREVLDGVPVLRLPLWIGHDSARQRIRQELAHSAWLGASLPALGRPDVIVAVSPSFPALLPTMIDAHTKGVPWTLWLQDILPDGAATTGLIRSGPLLTALRGLERIAYRSAERIFVISDAFHRNLVGKGVPPEKMTRIYNPSVAPAAAYRPPAPGPGPCRLLVMGNIGHSQGLAEFVAAVERGGVLGETGAVLRIAGHGCALDDVRKAIRSPQVELLGLLRGDAMEQELRSSTLGIVTQRSDITEFNLPSKLMNYMAHGLPVVAVVDPASECAHIVRESGAGWVVDSSRLDLVPALLRAVLADRDALLARGRAAHAYAAAHFSPERVAERFEHDLLALCPAVVGAVADEAGRRRTTRRRRRRAGGLRPAGDDHAQRHPRRAAARAGEPRAARAHVDRRARAGAAGTLGMPAATDVLSGAPPLRPRRRPALPATGERYRPSLYGHPGDVLLLLFGGRGESALAAALVTLGVLPGMIAQYYGLAILQGLGSLRTMQTAARAPGRPATPRP